MSDTTPPVPTPDPVPVPKPRRKSGSIAWLLALVVLASAGAAAYAYFFVWQGVIKVNFPANIRAGIIDPDRLGDDYADADSDMVADAPKDAAKLQDPETLLFSTLESPARAEIVWKEFIAHLEEATGKKVRLVETPPGGGGIAGMMRDRKLHVCSLSTGSVPLAVNTAGFVPLAVPANEKGEFAYQMEMLVKASSSVKGLADIKGKDLWLTSMSSLSSFKAPIMVLWTEQKLLPGRDYTFRIATGQRDTIKGVATGEMEVVAVANDLLAREVKNRKYDAGKFRSVYKSKSYPPLCFGCAHNLKPELRQKIREAFLSFAFKGTGLEKEYGEAGQVKFVPVDYKKDWAAVREVDKAILDLIEKNS